MRTSIHAIFNVVFGNVHFVIVISIIHGKKCNFLKVVKIPYPKNQILATLRSFFQRIKISQGGKGYFLLVHIEKCILTKIELSSWSQKRLFNFPQNY